MMQFSEILQRNLTRECIFSASRSSGPGGQNVNKVSTKVELRFNISGSFLLTEEEKEILLVKLAKKINADGELVLVSQSERSQLKNKEKVIQKFYELLARALTPRKKRTPTKPTLASKQQRLAEKKSRSEKKNQRKDPDLPTD